MRWRRMSGYNTLWVPGTGARSRSAAAAACCAALLSRPGGGAPLARLPLVHTHAAAGRKPAAAACGLLSLGPCPPAPDAPPRLAHSCGVCADHAGIATQTVVEKKIAREQGKTRHDLGARQAAAGPAGGRLASRCAGAGAPPRRARRPVAA